MDASFAVHPHDRRRADLYRDAVLAAGLQWADIEGDVRAYAAEQGWNDAMTTKQIGYVMRFFGGPPD